MGIGSPSLRRQLALRKPARVFGVTAGDGFPGFSTGRSRLPRRLSGELPPLQPCPGFSPGEPANPPRG
jgi:hypothetical protein